MEFNDKINCKVFVHLKQAKHDIAITGHSSDTMAMSLSTSVSDLFIYGTPNQLIGLLKDWASALSDEMAAQGAITDAAFP